jgi:hypothetical protein
MPLNLLAQVNITVYNERLAIVLGFITLIFVLATLLSCRSFISFLKLFKIINPLENRAFNSFYKYHSFYWYGFILSVILHLLVGIMHVRVSDPTDPDAYLHLYILIAGAVAFLVTIFIFLSCRSFAVFLNIVEGKSPFSGKWFSSLFRKHEYYWIFLILAVVVHFAFIYLHTGIWVN